MSKDQEEALSPKGGGAGGRTKEFVSWVKKAFNKSPSPKRRRFLSLDSINSPPSKPLVFGASLEELALGSSHKVPFIVRKIVEHIEENGLTEQGLYRVNGNTRLINDLRNTFDKMGDADFSCVDTATVGGLLKLWLRELPTPVIPDEIVPEFVEIQETNVGHASPERLAQLREAIHKLPNVNFELLKYLIKHLIKVTTHSAENKMTSVPLSIVFGPSIFRCGSGLQGLKDQGYTNSVVCRLIQNYEDIFEPSSGASPVGPGMTSPANTSSEGGTPSSPYRELPSSSSPQADLVGSAQLRRRFLSMDSGKPLVFGVSLEKLALGSSHKVPFIVRKIVEHLEENGLAEEGIYRVNGNTRLINDLRNTFDKKGDADFSYVDVATAGGLLKLWLRELPTPVIPNAIVPELVEIQETNVGHASPERLAQLREAIHKLPNVNFELLKYLIKHLIKVTTHSAENKMTSVSLSIVFGPSIFRCGSGLQGLKDQGYTNSVVCRLIQNYEDIFEQPSYVASPVGPGMTSPANTSSEGGQDKMEDSPPLTDPSGSHTPTSGHTVAKYHQRSALSVPNDLAIPKVHGGKGPKVKSTTGTAVATPLDPHEHDSRVTPIATSSNAAGNDGSRSPFVASMKTDGHSDSTVPTTTNGYVRVKAVVHGHRVQEDTKEAGAEEEVDGPVANISEARKDGRLLVGSKWADLSSTYPTPAVMSSANIDRLSTTSGAEGQQSPHRQARGRPVHHTARDTQHTEDAHRDTSAPDHHSRKRGGAQSSENSPSRSGEIKMDDTCDTMTATEAERSPFQRQYAKRKLAYAPVKAEHHGEATEMDPKSPSTRGESPWQSQASLKRLSNVVQACIDLHLCDVSTQSHYLGSNVYGLLIPHKDEMGTSQKVSKLQQSTPPHLKDESRAIMGKHLTSTGDSQVTTGTYPMTTGHTHRTLKGSSWSQPDFAMTDRSDHTMEGTTRSQPDPTPDPTPAKRHRSKAVNGSSRSQPDPTLDPTPAKGAIHSGTLSGTLSDMLSGTLSGTLSETLPGTLPTDNSLRSTISTMLSMLEEKRKKARRPYKILDMTPQQLQAEKHALQRTLLQFEKTHGKPVSKQDKELVRPLYERYRDVKRLYQQNERLSSTCAF